jgi:hypothetical protein
MSVRVKVKRAVFLLKTSESVVINEFYAKTGA